MKQKKIQNEEAPQIEQSAQDRLKRMLNSPANAEIPLFFEILNQAILKPLYHNDKDGMRKLGQRLNTPIAKIKDKLLNLEAGGYIERAAFILPCYRLRHGFTLETLAITLLDYETEIRNTPSRDINGAELITLMRSICPHLKELRDAKICALHRYPECEGCKWGCKQK